MPTKRTSRKRPRWRTSIVSPSAMSVTVARLRRSPPPLHRRHHRPRRRLGRLPRRPRPRTGRGLARDSVAVAVKAVRIAGAAVLVEALRLRLRPEVRAVAISAQLGLRFRRSRWSDCKGDQQSEQNSYPTTLRHPPLLSASATPFLAIPGIPPTGRPDNPPQPRLLRQRRRKRKKFLGEPGFGIERSLRRARRLQHRSPLLSSRRSGSRVAPPAACLAQNETTVPAPSAPRFKAPTG